MLAINIDYQGCSEDGFCYPPMTKYFMLNRADLSVREMTDRQNAVAIAPSFTALLTDQNGVGFLLENHPFNVMLLIFLGLGLLLAFTPCVLPMIPILASIIIGQKHTLGTKKAFFLSLTYVFGMSIAYACAGLIAASLGSSIQVWLQKPVIIIIVSALFMLLALSLFGLYELRFSRRWHNWISSWSNKHKGGTYVGVFFMGVLATLVVSPCVTAPLVGVLIYIGQTRNLVFGASALFAMGLGMGLPLLLIAQKRSLDEGCARIIWYLYDGNGHLAFVTYSFFWCDANSFWDITPRISRICRYLFAAPYSST
jgi:thiol:disulfide interchange protein DsbD